MNSIALITALTATTGMFGGKQCGGGKVHHAKKVKACYVAAPCGTSQGMTAYSAPMPAAYQPSSQMMGMQPVPAKGMPMGAPPVPPAPMAK